MSNFNDNMIEDGFDNLEEYLRYLQNLSFDIEEENIQSIEKEFIEELNIKNNKKDKKLHDYCFFEIDKNWNKIIINSIGTLILHKIFDEKYCRINDYSLDFFTFNFYEYHKASMSLFRRDISFIEREFFEKILNGGTNELKEANDYFKNKLLKHDSNDWKCSWGKIEIVEMSGKKCLMQTYSIRERKYMTRFNQNCYTFFFNQHQIEIFTRYDFIEDQLSNFDWNNIFKITLNSLKFHKEI